MKRQLVLLLLTLGLLSVGCASRRSIETSTAYDYPPRWIVYAIHPVGTVLDYAVARPITFIACTAPDVTGCTRNDELGIRKY